MHPVFSGLWPPVATPFRADGAVDEKRLIDHSHALLAEGSRGLAILGTTSEANSLTLNERRRVIDRHIEAGIAPTQLMPGTGACAVGDATVLTRHAGKVGAAGVLLLPPFYYKSVSNDGLFAFVAQVIEKAGPNVPRIMLYHIPQVAAVGWSLELVGRLRDAFPKVIAGMKDFIRGFRAHATDDRSVSRPCNFPRLRGLPRQGTCGGGCGLHIRDREHQRARYRGPNWRLAVVRRRTPPSRAQRGQKGGRHLRPYSGDKSSACSALSRRNVVTLAPAPHADGSIRPRAVACRSRHRCIARDDCRLATGDRTIASNWQKRAIFQRRAARLLDATTASLQSARRDVLPSRRCRSRSTCRLMAICVEILKHQQLRFASLQHAPCGRARFASR